MLVLTRKVNESVVIDGCIRVTVTSINGNKVRIGIEAPPDIPVHREEIRRALLACAGAESEVMSEPGNPG